MTHAGSQARPGQAEQVRTVPSCFCTVRVERKFCLIWAQGDSHSGAKRLAKTHLSFSLRRDSGMAAPVQGRRKSSFDRSRRLSRDVYALFCSCMIIPQFCPHFSYQHACICACPFPASVEIAATHPSNCLCNAMLVFSHEAQSEKSRHLLA